MDAKEIGKAKTTKDRLDLISKSFCAVKWKHATLNLAAGAVKSCCHMPFRSVSVDNLRHGFHLHDTAIDRAERGDMLEGRRPSLCSGCWNIEDQGHFSDRIVWSSKTWITPFANNLDKPTSDAAETPSWVELNFSNVCNLKCSYCSPIFSSRWLQEVKTFGPYPTSPGHNDIHHLNEHGLNENYDNTELMTRFWPWFEEIYPQLRLLKVTGGEPLLSSETFNMLKWIEAHPNPLLNVAINSNLMAPEKSWADLTENVSQILSKKSVRQFFLHPSIDTFGARAEYIRYGLNFDIFTRNVEDYLEKSGANLIFICTMNNLSLGGLQDFWKYLLNLKRKFGPRGQWVSVTTEILQSPNWQCINILPESYQRFVTETIEFANANRGASLSEFSAFEIQGLDRALDMMKSPAMAINDSRANFFRFFSEHDRRRRTDLLATFPEMNEFWRQCLLLSKAKSEAEECRSRESIYSI